MSIDTVNGDARSIPRRWIYTVIVYKKKCINKGKEEEENRLRNYIVIKMLEYESVNWISFDKFNKEGSKSGEHLR